MWEAGEGPRLFAGWPRPAKRSAVVLPAVRSRLDADPAAFSRQFLRRRDPATRSGRCLHSRGRASRFRSVVSAGWCSLPPVPAPSCCRCLLHARGDVASVDYPVRRRASPICPTGGQLGHHVHASLFPRSTGRVVLLPRAVAASAMQGVPPGDATSFLYRGSPRAPPVLGLCVRLCAPVGGLRTDRSGPGCRMRRRHPCRQRELRRRQPRRGGLLLGHLHLRGGGNHLPQQHRTVRRRGDLHGIEWLLPGGRVPVGGDGLYWFFAGRRVRR